MIQLQIYICRGALAIPLLLRVAGLRIFRRTRRKPSAICQCTVVWLCHKAMSSCIHTCFALKSHGTFLAFQVGDAVPDITLYEVITFRWKAGRVKYVLLAACPSRALYHLRIGSFCHLCHQGTPDGKVNLKELFGNGKGIILGLPGAYTPECSSVRT